RWRAGLVRTQRRASALSVMSGKRRRAAGRLPCQGEVGAFRVCSAPARPSSAGLSVAPQTGDSPRDVPSWSPARGRDYPTEAELRTGMQREDLMFVGTCDLSGLVRGKAFPASDCARRMRRGVGFTHSNIIMSAFGPIYATPFGTEGDLMLVPDESAQVQVPFLDGPSERFFLGDLRTTDGTPMLTRQGIGNGTHIHFSLVDASGAPATHDPARLYGLSPAGESFAAGVLQHMP